MILRFINYILQIINQRYQVRRNEIIDQNDDSAFDESIILQSILRRFHAQHLYMRI